MGTSTAYPTPRSRGVQWADQTGTALRRPDGSIALLPVCATNSLANYSTDAANRNHASSTYVIRGIDAVAGTLFVLDSTGGVLRQCDSPSAATPSWGSSKGLPTDVTYANCVRLLRFGSSIYMLAKTTTDSIYKIFSATPNSQSSAFTWSSVLHAMTDANSTALQTSFEADASYMYLAEYGDPGAGPRAWRSADGATWSLIYGPDATMRHIHAITPDPYRPGHVYMTCGDGVSKAVQRSTDYGSTWATVVSSSGWQAVQISFSEKAVYFAGDSQRGIVWYMDRDELVPRWLTPATLANLAVPKPAALTDQFYLNAWYGAIDPATGIYYASANDSSAGGTIPASFQIVGPGAYPSMIHKYAAIQSWVVIAFGRAWIGMYHHNLGA